MKSQQKYDECLIILSEMHDISHTMIEAGMDEGLSPTELLEEALRVIKTIDENKLAVVTKKDKTTLH